MICARSGLALFSFPRDLLGGTCDVFLLWGRSGCGAKCIRRFAQESICSKRILCPTCFRAGRPVVYQPVGSEVMRTTTAAYLDEAPQLGLPEEPRLGYCCNAAALQGFAVAMLCCSAAVCCLLVALTHHFKCAMLQGTAEVPLTLCPQVRNCFTYLRMLLVRCPPLR